MFKHSGEALTEWFAFNIWIKILGMGTVNVATGVADDWVGKFSEGDFHSLSKNNYNHSIYRI